MIALSITAEAAERLLARSLTLVHRLPGTLAALEAGALHPGHLWPMLEKVAPIANAPVRAEVEAELLRWAAGRVVTPAQLGAKARREVLHRDVRAAARGWSRRSRSVASTCTRTPSTAWPRSRRSPRCPRRRLLVPGAERPRRGPRTTPRTRAPGARRWSTACSTWCCARGRPTAPGAGAAHGGRVDRHAGRRGRAGRDRRSGRSRRDDPPGARRFAGARRRGRTSRAGEPEPGGPTARGSRGVRQRSEPTTSLRWPGEGARANRPAGWSLVRPDATADGLSLAGGHAGGPRALGRPTERTAEMLDARAPLRTPARRMPGPRRRHVETSPSRNRPNRLRRPTPGRHTMQSTGRHGTGGRLPMPRSTRPSLDAVPGRARKMARAQRAGARRRRGRRRRRGAPGRREPGRAARRDAERRARRAALDAPTHSASCSPTCSPAPAAAGWSTGPDRAHRRAVRRAARPHRPARACGAPERAAPARAAAAPRVHPRPHAAGRAWAHPVPPTATGPRRRLDRWMRARDRRCRFPGLPPTGAPRRRTRPHRPYPLGPTSASNLAGYCTTDHRGQAPGTRLAARSSPRRHPHRHHPDRARRPSPPRRPTDRSMRGRRPRRLSDPDLTWTMADPSTYRPAVGSIPESPGVYRFRDPAAGSSTSARPRASGSG